jgi:hypothetical protein
MLSHFFYVLKEIQIQLATFYKPNSLVFELHEIEKLALAVGTNKKFEKVWFD